MVFCDFFLDFCRLTDCLNCHLVFSDMKGLWWGDEGDKKVTIYLLYYLEPPTAERSPELEPIN